MADTGAHQPGGTDGQDVDAILRAYWHSALNRLAPRLRRAVSDAIDAHAGRLASVFYQGILGDPRGSTFLDHAVVNERLHASLERWLRHLFATDVGENEQVGFQRVTGQVHARIGVPTDLVARGARLLKLEIGAVLDRSLPDRADLVSALAYGNELIDLAIETMNAAFSSSHAGIIRSDESYRLFFLGQNIKAERARQQMQLTDWVNDLLIRYIWPQGEAGDAPPPRALDDSPFGVWLEHKASIVFADAPEMGLLRAHAQRIERELLPRLAQLRDQPREAQAIVAAVNREVEEIKSLLGTMFEQAGQMNDLSDAATQLLSHRYFPIAARREVSYAIHHRSGFALLLLELDDLSQIRQLLGVGGSDMVMAQLAQQVSDHVRAADFVFRLGEERLGMLLVQTGRPQDAMLIAESLRAAVAAQEIRTAYSARLSVTACIGVAHFDGHPDYQRLVDRAEDALRSAKAAGAGSVRLAP